MISYNAEMTTIVERQYRQNLPIYTAVQTSLMSELESPELLRYSGANIYRVTSRIKTLDSLLGKLARRKIIADEQALNHVTDIVGARIVCLFQEDLERIHQYLSSCGAFRFCDKPKAYIWDGMDWVVDDEEFIVERKRTGYGALHYIAQFSQELVGEHEPTAQIKFELQVRTMMQEAWAALEHSVGYKNNVPDRIRGYFDSAADLLGLIDRAFQRLKTESNRLESELDQEHLHGIVPLNFYTLKQLAEQEFGVKLAGRNFSELLKQLLDSPVKTIEAARAILHAPVYQQALKDAYQTTLNRVPAVEDQLRWLPFFNNAIAADANGSAELTAMVIKRIVQTDEYRRYHAQELLAKTLRGLDYQSLAEVIEQAGNVQFIERNIWIEVSDLAMVAKLRGEHEKLIYGGRLCFGPIAQIFVNDDPVA